MTTKRKTFSYIDGDGLLLVQDPEQPHKFYPFGFGTQVQIHGDLRSFGYLTRSSANGLMYNGPVMVEYESSVCIRQPEERL